MSGVFKSDDQYHPALGGFNTNATTDALAYRALNPDSTNRFGSMETLQGASGLLAVSGALQKVVTGACRLYRMNIVQAGSTTGAIYDVTAASSGSVGFWNMVTPIANTIGLTVLDFPITDNVYVSCGTNQVITLTYTQ